MQGIIGGAASRKRLTAKGVENLQHSGRTRSAERHYDRDGTGLAINVQAAGTKSWVQGLTVHGKRRWLGLGPYPVITLKRAREKALENKRLAYEGRDPIAERDGARRMPTFQDLAVRVIDMQAADQDTKSTAQWQSSLATYAYPLIGRKRVDRITVGDVMKCVEPIWSTKRETASRVRQRIASILDAAIAYGHRDDNPARAALHVLPKSRAPVKHHRALPYSEVSAAIATVRASGAWIGTRLGLEFLILTATRSGEVRGATWSEIDLDAATWTIPGERMKANVPHRVPLADRCLELLAAGRKITDPPMTSDHVGCPLVFPSMRGKVITNATFSKLMRDHGIAAVPHGFRSSFRDWAAETTDAPHAVMEAALAHTISSAVEAAYARSDLLERRRTLMKNWAAFAAGGAGGAR